MAPRCHVSKDGITLAFFRGMQTNSTEPSESSANTARDIVFQCPHCRTTLKLEEDGTVLIPDLPGIGVDVDLDFVRAHRVN